MKKILPILLLMIITPIILTHCQNRLTGFTPGIVWVDNNDVHINAHGGGILYFNNTYYWYGEHKVEGKAGNTAQVGVRCYSSSDLYNWKDEGIALAVSDDSTSDIAKGCILERPKVIYNAKTNKFVMWFHLEIKSSGYNSARSGVAVADNATGPFTFIKSMRPDAGYWPVNVREDQKDPKSIALAIAQGERFSNGENAETPRFNILGRDMQNGQQARDMTLFVDDDSSAYHIYSSEHNSTLHISKLTDDYLDHSGLYIRVFEYRWMEAPAMFKHDGKYYLIASGCTGWAPNMARSAVAESILGNWQELSNPCIGGPVDGPGPDLTFGGQSTFVFPVIGKENAFIAMFDVWNPDNAIDGRYLWLPVKFEDTGFSIKWYDKWDLSVFNN